jgi:hypothetical protein
MRYHAYIFVCGGLVPSVRHGDVGAYIARAQAGREKNLSADHSQPEGCVM